MWVLRSYRVPKDCSSRAHAALVFTTTQLECFKGLEGQCLNLSILGLGFKSEHLDVGHHTLGWLSVLEI